MSRHHGFRRWAAGTIFGRARRPLTERDRAFQDALRDNTLQGGSSTDFLRRLEEIGHKFDRDVPSSDDHGHGTAHDHDSQNGTGSWLERLWLEGNSHVDSDFDDDRNAGDQHERGDMLPHWGFDPHVDQEAAFGEPMDPFLGAPLADSAGHFDSVDNPAPVPPWHIGGDQHDPIQDDIDFDDDGMDNLFPHAGDR